MPKPACSYTPGGLDTHTLWGIMGSAGRKSPHVTHLIEECPMSTTTSNRPAVAASRWPLERILFAMGGTMTLISALLAAISSPWFLLLTAFVGVNQWLYVSFRACPASMILQRFGRDSQCIW